LENEEGSLELDVNQFMDWTDIEIEQIQDRNYDEDWVETLDEGQPLFDAWEDEVHEGHPKVQMFKKRYVPDELDWRKEKGVVTPVK
jgi:hypothetical protein